MNKKNIILNEAAMCAYLPDHAQEIVKIFRSDLTPPVIQERIRSFHEGDIATAMEHMSRDERRRLYAVLNTEALAGILEYAEQYIDELSIRKRIDVLSRMEPSTVAEYLRQTEKENRTTILDLLSEEVKAEIQLLNSFDEDEIGSRMSTNFITIKAGSSIKTAMAALIEQAAQNDNISTLYVVDGQGVLLGAIDLKDLITAREGINLGEITMTSYPYVYANEEIEDCIVRISNYSEGSIPVLDPNNKLKGVLLSQDIIELVGSVMGEDYAKLGGLSAEVDLHEPMKKSIGKRLPWLGILLCLGLLVSGVVGIFEHVVAHLALIVCFQSLILDMAGNVGTQSLAVTIRVLMDERLRRKDKLCLLGKEARVGLANGLILGILSFAFVGGYIVLFKGEAPMYAFSISLCTGLAMLVSIVLASVTGTIIPILFKKMKIDPAVASGPLITTINDLVAVVSYYGLAWVLLINVLGL